ncbi:hypothetical protein IMCC26207_10724 [Actinobacteria bacterium IMCC26207]|nr:hypothetical protein IMCC26207_10724 [Actinobacteria bacterium IMCC26207]
MSATLSEKISAHRAVDEVKADHLLLPGIQRKFVWQPSQIYKLFDSLMRGYPIGTLLLWRTRPADHPELRFRRLITNYDGPNTQHKTVKPPKASQVYAVLDGQQRLTALNLGLRGSHRGKATTAQRFLFLDLDSDTPEAGSEDNQYSFLFRHSGGCVDEAWFQVSDVRGLAVDAPSLNTALRRAGLTPSAKRRRVLKTLALAIKAPTLRLQVESSRDLDRVLNIFARTNMGGTKLTFVDLLVSTATARWKYLDAAEEIDKLRREINKQTPEPFRFSADRIVKAGLVVLGGNAKFHVEDFMKAPRAQKLEEIWPEFAESMKLAAKLLSSFGLSERSLPAQNVIIPLTYYVYHRRLKPSYVSAHSHEKDRHRVRAFVARSLLQRRYWTGDVDAVLVATRSAIKSNGSSSFPLEEIERALRISKPIAVTDSLLDELCEIRYADRRTITLLRLLFPQMVHHRVGTPKLDKDHIFPISKVNGHQLQLASVPAVELSRLTDMADKLPNLQLLSAEDNRGGKNAKMPADWLSSLSRSARARYTAQEVKRVPHDLAGFENFWDTRRLNLRDRIEKLLEP